MAKPRVTVPPLQLSWLPGVTAGIDEAGRGPLAGPVVAAAVIFHSAVPDGLADSKKLSARRRDALFAEINAMCWVGVGVASAFEIDTVNILQATFLAMRRAVLALPVRPSVLHVDGNQKPVFEGHAPEAVHTLVQGDGLVAQIAAASIVAKVTRDRMMVSLDEAHPEYGFARNSGYGVPEHLAALKARGPCPAHRRSFEPVKSMKNCGIFPVCGN